MKQTDIFAHPFCEIEFPNYEKIQAECVAYVTAQFDNEFANEYQGHDHPIKNGSIKCIYDKFSKPLESPAFIELHDWIQEQGKKYWEVLNLTKFLDPYVMQYWVNAVPRGGFVASHNHNPVPISGVFYINAEPRMGNLYLENPMELVLGKSAYHTDTRTPTRFTYEVESKSGKLVFFPGWMKHHTKPNPTDDIRMSMAVNYGCVGQVNYTEFI
jgi:uncharacterized protein (TIGR02466 family)